jgi:hypothetical protein
MAYFAEVGSNNIVIRVVVVDDEYDNEAGSSWCQNFFGGGTWVRTVQDGSIRANYAGRGYTFDPVNDVFIPPKPWPSWSLNAENYQWDPPVPHPRDGVDRDWNEETQTWEES